MATRTRLAVFTVTVWASSDRGDDILQQWSDALEAMDLEGRLSVVTQDVVSKLIAVGDRSIKGDEISVTVDQ